MSPSPSLPLPFAVAAVVLVLVLVSIVVAVAAAHIAPFSEPAATADGVGLARLLVIWSGHLEGIPKMFGAKASFRRLLCMFWALLLNYCLAPNHCTFWIVGIWDVDNPPPHFVYVLFSHPIFTTPPEIESQPRILALPPPSFPGILLSNTSRNPGKTDPVIEKNDG